MEKEVHNSSHNSIPSRERHIIGEGLIRPSQSADFVLRWGNRKRLRCMKIQVKDNTTSVHRTTRTVDRRVITAANGASHPSHGHFNLRQRPASPAHPPQRILRNNLESGIAMKLHQNYQSNRGVKSPERGGGEKKGSGAHNENNGVRTASSEKGCSSSGGSDVVVWPPKFMIALTNKEKEEDFMAIKGSKLPQRPKKRAKVIQRTLNLVSPGGWLCDLTLERYEVREKKTSKKRPRGLKAMGNYMDSESD